MTTKTDSGYVENNGWLPAKQQLQLQRRDHSVITFFKQNVIPDIRLSSLAPLSQSCKYSILTDSPPAIMVCLPLFPCSSTFAWLQHTSPFIVLCVTARVRSPLLFLVSECVREVFVHLWKAYSFRFSSIITYCVSEEAPTFMLWGWKFVSMGAFPSFTRKKRTRLWQYRWLVFLLGTVDAFKGC